MKTRRSSNFYSKKYGNFFVLYELNSWPQDLNTDFALGGCLFGGKMLIQINPQYSINFGRPGTRFCFSLHCNGNNSFLFVNATKIHKFKTKGSQIKKYIICLGNISGDFSANNMKKKKTGWNGYVYDFSVGYRAFGTCNIINIHKHLKEKHVWNY